MPDNLKKEQELEILQVNEGLAETFRGNINTNFSKIKEYIGNIINGKNIKIGDRDLVSWLQDGTKIVVGTDSPSDEVFASMKENDIYIKITEKT